MSQFVIACELAIVVRGECSQLRPGRVFLPLLTHREVEIAIENPVGFFLLTDLKSRIWTPLCPQLFRRPHFEISCNQRRHRNGELLNFTLRKFYCGNSGL